MNLSALKKIRIVISLSFFAAISLIFLDFRNLIPTKYISSVLFLQFVPSTLKFFVTFSAAALGFVIILFLTVLFGRVYCSAICPLGTLQDFIIFISRKLRIKKFFRFTKELKILRFSILAVAVLFIPLGGMFIVTLLDPYSNFGRILTDLVKPGVVAGNNLLSSAFEHFENYSLYPMEQTGMSVPTLVVPIIVLAVVIGLSIKKGRLYCNSICPVGALLGLVSKYSIFKIVIDDNNCSGCGKCELACKASCINKKTHEVDFSRCVGCMDCLATCPSEGVKYEYAYKKTKKAEKPETDFNKRDFLVSTSVYMLGFAGLLSGRNKALSGNTAQPITGKRTPVSPPGSKSISHFTANCTACHLCVSECPTKVLQPAYLEYGLLGIIQPHMEAKNAFCNYECNICGNVCPSGAILPLTLEEKKKTQIGVAKFNQNTCIVFTESTDCGACSEHCPTKAVNMVPYNGLFAPKVTEELCIGCGACEFACPTDPNKSIIVEGNAIHKTAKKNIQKKSVEAKQQKSSTPQEDFPF
jgi:ferredoxin